MPGKKLSYSKTLDQTYLTDENGGITTYSGDVRGNPGLFSQSEMASSDDRGRRLKGTPGNDSGAMDLIKDIGVDTATAIPMMIPGGGIGGSIMRMLGGGLAGGITDQMLHKDKPMTQTIGDVGLNALISELGPLAFEKLPGARLVNPMYGKTKSSVTVHGPSAFSSETVGNLERRGAMEGSGFNEFTGKNSGSTSNTGEIQSHSVRQPFEASAPHTPAMEAIQSEIDRLGNMPYTKNTAKQIDAAIAKNQAALDALQEAGTTSGVITDTTGKRSGENTFQGERSGSARATRRGTSSSQGTNNSITTGTRTTGDIQMNGYEEGSRSGALGYIGDILRASHFGKNPPMNALERLFTSLGFNIGADATVNAPR